MCMLDLLNCFLFYNFVVLLKLSKKRKKIKKTVDIVEYIWYIINALEKDAKEIVL